MSIDLADRGIWCQLLHPGWVRTRMTEGRGLIDADESARGLIRYVILRARLFPLVTIHKLFGVDVIRSCYAGRWRVSTVPSTGAGTTTRATRYPGNTADASDPPQNSPRHRLSPATRAASTSRPPPPPSSPADSPPASPRRPLAVPLPVRPISAPPAVVPPRRRLHRDRSAPPRPLEHRHVQRRGVIPGPLAGSVEPGGGEDLGRDKRRRPPARTPPRAPPRPAPAAPARWRRTRPLPPVSTRGAPASGTRGGRAPAPPAFAFSSPVGSTSTSGEGAKLRDWEVLVDARDRLRDGIEIAITPQNPALVRRAKRPDAVARELHDARANRVLQTGGRLETAPVADPARGVSRGVLRGGRARVGHLAHDRAARHRGEPRGKRDGGGVSPSRLSSSASSLDREKVFENGRRGPRDGRE